MERLQVKELKPRVLSKLRNGHKIRVMKGTGIEILVKPETYSQITKSFTKNKGSTLQLSGEELLANKEVEGGSLFKDLKRGVNKLGKALAPTIKEVKKVAEPLIEKATPVAQKIGKIIIKEAEDKGIPIAKTLAKEAVKKGVKYAPEALAAAAIATGNPQLAPVALAVGKPLSKEAGKALNKKIDNFELKKRKPITTPQSQPIMFDSIPPRVRPLPRAVQMPEKPDFNTSDVSFEGQGLYAGRGLYAGKGLFGSGVMYPSGKGLISGKLGRENVALKSQPQFTNEIMRRQMGRVSNAF